MKKKSLVFLGLLIICILISVLVNIFLSYNTKNGLVDERLYQNHFVAHGRTNSYPPLPDNSLILFETLITKGYKAVECDIFFTKDTVPVLCHESNIKIASKGHSDVEISEINYFELSQYNFSKDSIFVSITTLEQLIKLAANKHILVQMDLAKQSFERHQYKKIYEILSKYNMTKNCIWEIRENDFFNIAEIDHSLIFQIDETWDRTTLIKLLMKKRFCSLIICSSWYDPQHHFSNDEFDKYERIISFGKRMGFLMKVATINDNETAKQFFGIGVNLITTDCLHDDKDAK